MYITALILAIIAWTAQLYQTAVKKDNKIHIFLPLAYFIACVLFTLDAFFSNNMLSGILDLICAVLVLIVLILLIVRKKS